MPISGDAYQALEAVVGQDNISNGPAILDSYAYQFWAEFKQYGSKFMPRPAAAILPATTEEVQAIVKTCNRYQMKFKAHSTGWGFYGAPYQEGGLQIDLRRMDRIWEIDTANNLAVIEPYVISATLQAEAMKRGLNTHIIGAGASTAPIAAATSFEGAGADSIYMGHGPENLLGAEWVMPDGEIMRTGALGSGCGWFCGDGPGPSLRALFNGSLGHAGGLGVFTRVAIKLYPWPGPAVMPIGGRVPVYTSPLPDCIQGYTLAWPEWQDYADALYLIFDNDIGYIAHRQYIMFGNELQAQVLRILTDPEKRFNDLELMLRDPNLNQTTQEMSRSFQLVLAGMTPGDIDYQQKVLDYILERTGGWKVAMMEEPLMKAWSNLYMIRLCYKNFNYVLAGGYWDAMMRAGTPDLMASGWMQQMKQQNQRFGREGGVIDHGGDAGMGGVGSMGGGGYPAFENFVLYDPGSAESISAARACSADAGRVTTENTAETGGGGTINSPSPMFMKDERRQAMLLSLPHPEIMGYQRQIQEIVDPNHLGDGWYLTLPEKEVDKD